MDGIKYEKQDEAELLEKIQQEIEVLESIYGDDNVVLKAPEIVQNAKASEDFSEFQSGQAKEFEFQQTACVIPVELEIKPKTGGDDAKVGLEYKCEIVFNQFYPFNSPSFSFKIKGVDDQQKDEITNKVNQELNNFVKTRREDEDDMGFVYEFYEGISDILTKYNDTCKGRCAICLEPFSTKEPGGTGDEEEEEEVGEDEKFTERPDLVRIDVCYHRFRLMCLYRDWFMPRKSETDQFGCVLEYKLPDEKRCPICRRLVDAEEVEYIRKLAEEHPEFDDHGYDQQ